MLNTNENNNDNNKTATINQLPKATHQGKLKLDGVIIDVAILDNKMRVISVKSLYKLFEANRSKAVNGLPYFLSANYLKPYLTEELKELATNKVKYFDKHFNEAECFDVAIIPYVAEIFIMAETSKYVKQRIVDKAFRISAMLYIKGATELVDEVLLHKRVEKHLPFDINKIPTKVFTDVKEAKIPYGEIDITVAIVEDIPVITVKNIFSIFALSIYNNIIDGLPAFASAKYIRKHLSEDGIRLLKNPIKYINKQNKEQKAYSVHVITLIFEAYSKAFIAGDIKKKHIIERYKHLRRAYMNVSVIGIVSMVDEAVGYERKEDEKYVTMLQRLLGDKATYIRIKKFNEIFYLRLFRLLNLDYEKQRYLKLPIVAEFVAKYVYGTMHKDLYNKLKKLRDNDEIDTTGRLHNYFSEDHGIFMLQLHINDITFRLIEAKTLDEFKKGIEDKPLYFTPEKIKRHTDRINFFKLTYYSNQELIEYYQDEFDFIFMSCNIFHAGDIDNSIFYSPQTNTRFAFVEKHPHGFYMHKKLYQFFKHIERNESDNASDLIPEIREIFENMEDSICRRTSEDVFDLAVIGLGFVPDFS